MSRCTSLTERITIRGLRYGVRHWGDPKAPIVFFLHGWMDWSTTFQFVVDALKTTWHLIAPDWRGYLTKSGGMMPLTTSPGAADIAASQSNDSAPIRKRFNKAPATVDALEEFGRVRLSKSFFMRDFLYSEISQIENIPNIPDDPELAILVGQKLCNNVLEPIQERLGRISIRSSLRSCAVNARGAANKNQFRCSSNEATYANHIWDRKNADGYMGATACIVVNSFIDYYDRTGNWEALAWWIHENIPGYSDLVFYPRLAAFNISWHQ